MPVRTKSRMMSLRGSGGNVDIDIGTAGTGGTGAEEILVEINSSFESMVVKERNRGFPAIEGAILSLSWSLSST